jgi:hypothetical protein
MEKSKYKGRLDALTLKARFVESAARRNLAALEPYGITEGFLDEFSADIVAFSHFPSDEDMREKTNDWTVAKKKIRTEMTAHLRYFGHHFREVFGRESSAYTRMNIRNLNSLGENKLLGIALMAAFRAHGRFAELSAHGVTAEAVAAFDDFVGRSITAFNAAEAAEDDRTAATAARIAAANAIFDGCTRICRAGKQAFRNNSAARKNFVMK